MFFKRRILYIEKYAARSVFIDICLVILRTTNASCISILYIIICFGHIFDSKVIRGDGAGEGKKCPSGNSHDRLYGSRNIIRFGTVRGRRRRSSISSSAPHIYIGPVYNDVFYIIFFSPLLRINTLGEHKGCAPKVSNSRMYESGN